MHLGFSNQWENRDKILEPVFEPTCWLVSLWDKDSHLSSSLLSPVTDLGVFRNKPSERGIQCALSPSCTSESLEILNYRQGVENVKDCTAQTAFLRCLS